MNRRHLPARRRTAAFTLVELLVAAGLTLLVVTGLIALLRQAGDVARRTTERINQELQAQRVLDYLTSDLQSVVWQRDGSVSLVAVISPDHPATGVTGETWTAPVGALVKPIAAEGSLHLAGPLVTQRFGQAGVRLALFTAPAGPAAAAAGPVAVSYQLVRRRETPSTAPTYQLMRAWVGAAQTFTAGYDFGAEATYWQPDDTPRAAGNIARPPATAVLAQHVVDWGLRLLNVSETGEETCLFPPALPPWEYWAVAPGLFPTQAELAVRVLTEEGARQLALLEVPPAGRPAGADWWQTAEAHSTVFTRRVLLPAGP